MVGYRDGPEGELQLVDVFENGKLLTVEQAALDLTDSGQFPEEALAPAAKREILLRILRNLVLTTLHGILPTEETIPYLNLGAAIDPLWSP
jgi:hypothetical protein